jgi:hypothetical protein
LPNNQRQYAILSLFVVSQYGLILSAPFLTPIKRRGCAVSQLISNFLGHHLALQKFLHIERLAPRVLKNADGSLLPPLERSTVDPFGKGGEWSVGCLALKKTVKSDTYHKNTGAGVSIQRHRAPVPKDADLERAVVMLWINEAAASPTTSTHAHWSAIAHKFLVAGA